MEIKLHNVKCDDLPKINLDLNGESLTTIVGEKRNTLIKLLGGNNNYSGKITYNDTILNKKNKLIISKTISYVPKKFVNKFSKDTLVEYINYLI